MRATSVPIVRPFRMQVRLLRVARACVSVTCTAFLSAFLVSHMTRAQDRTQNDVRTPVAVAQVAPVITASNKDQSQVAKGDKLVRPVIKQTTNKQYARHCVCRCH